MLLCDRQQRSIAICVTIKKGIGNLVMGELVMGELVIGNYSISSFP